MIPSDKALREAVEEASQKVNDIEAALSSDYKPIAMKLIESELLYLKPLLSLAQAYLSGELFMPQDEIEKICKRYDKGQFTDMKKLSKALAGKIRSQR